MISPAAVYQNGPLEIDLKRLEVTLAGAPMQVTGLQRTLLLHLAQRAGDLVTREELRQQLWGPCAPERDVRLVDVLVCRLRARLGTAAHLIQSLRPHGYRLQASLVPWPAGSD